jgi:carbon starvation protein
MQTLLIALAAGVAFILAYHTYGRWLGKRIFELSAQHVCPSIALRDDNDFVPTHKSIVFGHHFTSIAGTGPIVGPAIAVMWGWLPALLWVIFGSIFIGAVHDLGALVVSLRNQGQTVGDIAGRLINPRVRVLFLLVLFMALTIVLAIFGLVIAAVFRQYPASIFPVWIQLPIAVAIGVYLHRKGKGLFWPSMIALALMYLTVVFGDQNTRIGIAFFDDTIGGALHAFNTWAAALPIIVWVAVLLVYSYIASVLPVWVLLQPRDYINSLQLISALGLIVAGLVAAAFWGGAPPVPGAPGVPLTMAAPMVQWSPEGAPAIFPFLFITVACGAISGFHCLVSSGTSSKQLRSEEDARFVGYGAMLTEGFLAVLVILACCAGLGLGIRSESAKFDFPLTGSEAWQATYTSWGASQGLGQTVAAFVNGSANFLKAIGVPAGVAVALMGVLVASFAGTTMDTACRLQRYVVQELAAAFLSPFVAGDAQRPVVRRAGGTMQRDAARHPLQVPLRMLYNKHGATVFACVVALAIAAMPAPGKPWSWQTSGGGGLILWPLFGATNQLLAGLAFMVIAFYLLRRNRPVWFLILPGLFMLVMPMWALLHQVFIASPGSDTGWLEDRNWLLLGIALATVALEIWMVIEAVMLWPRVRGVKEVQLPTPNSLAPAPIPDARTPDPGV